MFSKLQEIDRRYIFLFIGLAAFIPLIFPLGLPLGVTPSSEDLFNAVDSLKEGSVVILTFDYYPSTLPETQPMSYAALRHLFRKNLRVVNDVAREHDKEYGVDYVNLGYKYGYVAVMLGMGRRIADIFPRDNYNTKLEDIPLMQEVKNYDDVDFLFVVADNATVDYWVSLVNAQFGLTMAPKSYSFLQTGQMVGLLGGMKGAAEYEKLSQNPGWASRGMDPQSIIHFLIILFILLGNVGYFVSKRTRIQK